MVKISKRKNGQQLMIFGKDIKALIFSSNLEDICGVIRQHTRLGYFDSFTRTSLNIGAISPRGNHVKLLSDMYVNYLPAIHSMTQWKL